MDQRTNRRTYNNVFKLLILVLHLVHLFLSFFLFFFFFYFSLNTKKLKASMAQHTNYSSIPNSDPERSFGVQKTNNVSVI